MLAPPVSRVHGVKSREKNVDKTRQISVFQRNIYSIKWKNMHVLIMNYELWGTISVVARGAFISIEKRPFLPRDPVRA
jgi:hypothetical protein